MSKNYFSITLLLVLISCSPEQRPVKITPDEKEIARLEKEIALENEEIKPCVYQSLNNRIDTLSLFNLISRVEIRSYDKPYEGHVINVDALNNSSNSDKDPRNEYDEKIVLNKLQTDSLFKLLTGFNVNNNPIGADCFFPRHMIAFFGVDKKILGTIDICFECSRIEFHIKGYDFLCDEQLMCYMDFLKWCGIKKGFLEN